MAVADGVVVARTLGEARRVIDELQLGNWVPVSPKKLISGLKVLPHVLVVGDFQMTEPISASVSVASGGQELSVARVDLV